MPWFLGGMEHGKGKPRKAVARWVPFRGGLLLEAKSDERCWKVVHQDYSICVVHRGGADWSYRHRLFSVRPGTIYVCEPGEVHVTRKAHGPGDFSVLFLEPALVETMAQELGLTSVPHFPAEGVADLRLWQCYASLPALLRASGEDAFLAELSRITGMLLSRARGLRIPPRTSALLVARAQGRLAEGLRDDPCRTVRLDALARELGVSYHGLIHGFSRHCAVPPYQYLGMLRAQLAFRTLRQGPNGACNTLRDVAAQCGYADAAHLSRAFRSHWGVPPSSMARDIEPAWLKRASPKA